MSRTNCWTLTVSRILIVEDEPLIALMLADWISELGMHPIGPAYTVSEALALLGSTPIDGAVVDINLGHERSDAVVELLAGKQIPFVLTTGESGNSAYPQLGHAAKLMKPYDFAACEAVLGLLCPESRSQCPAT